MLFVSFVIGIFIVKPVQVENTRFKWVCLERPLVQNQSILSILHVQPVKVDHWLIGAPLEQPSLQFEFEEKKMKKKKNLNLN